MVIIPEQNIHHEIPDPAGETEIIRILIEQGYSVIDQKITSQIRKNKEYPALLPGNEKLAMEIGLKSGADIVLFGKVFSESSPQVVKGFQSCRARIELRPYQRRMGKFCSLVKHMLVVQI